MDDIERYEDGHPTGDGYYCLTFKVDPFNEKPRDGIPPTKKLEFRDYRKGFRITHEHGEFFEAWHNEGHKEMYLLHNILYIELHPNSEHVSDAIVAWRKVN